MYAEPLPSGEETPPPKFEFTLRWPTRIFNRAIRITSEVADRKDIILPVSVWQKGKEMGFIVFDRGEIRPPEDSEGQPLEGGTRNLILNRHPNQVHFIRTGKEAQEVR